MSRITSGMGESGSYRPELNAAEGTVHTQALGGLARASEHFYHEGSDIEADRLQMMAQIADKVSASTIRSLCSERHIGVPLTVVDIGAGDSTTLACKLVADGFEYVPVDMRKDAVEAHRRAGLPAVQSIATQLEIESGSVDVAHARFTWGWLSDDERLQSLAEILRIGRDDIAITIIDYDWSCADGPPIFVDMIEKVKSIMRQTGFDPDYGRGLEEDLGQKLHRLIEVECTVMQERTPTLYGDMAQALPMIAQTASAIAEQLRGIGMQEQADLLIADLEILNAYAHDHPTEQVRLPDIVSASVVIDGKDDKLTPAMKLYLDATDGIGSHRFEYEKLQEGVDFERALPDIDSAHRVVIALSNDMIKEARHIQTLAYYKRRIVGLDAVGDGGVLVSGNDPPELVNRSIYLVTIEDGNNWMDGGVRIIRPDREAGIRSLPTIERIYQHCPITSLQLEEYPFMQSSEETVEVSGMAKNMLGGSFSDVALAMVVLADVAIRQGYRYGVMGLQESQVKLVEGIFGTQAVRRIEGEDAIHQIDLPGVKEGVRFVPMYVDGRTFIEEVYKYACTREGSVFEMLREVTSEIFLSRENRKNQTI